jgi:cytochrome c-type biogenesis protein CcmH/NrfG
MNQTEDSDLQTKKAIGPWTLFAGILLIAFVAYLALLQVANYVTERSTEHYQSMGAAEVLTNYMERNEGTWPTKVALFDFV